MGSKNRIAKHILPIMLKDRKPGQYFCEPFCGGLGTLDKVDGNRIGSDANKYLIAMWLGLQNEEPRPYQIDKEMYNKARNDFNQNTNKHFNDFLIGWIGWMASFNGRFFDGGYSGQTAARNYIEEQIRNTHKQFDLIKGIDFRHGDYSQQNFPDNSIIYCDIPYKGTKQYATSKNFDYEKFYHWCLEQKEKGHTVFLSEYNAPSFFSCIWEMEITNSMHTTKTTKPVERLFKL